MKKESNVLSGVVTTTGRPSEQMVKRANDIAVKWKLPFIERNKKSIQKMIEQWNTTIFIVRTSGIEAHHRCGDQPFFFHPNAAMFRAKRLYRYGDDPIVSICNVEEGDVVVDATLGLGSDAQLASLATGEKGKVIGLESSPIVAHIVSEGLSTYESSFQPLNEAMRRIEVLHVNHLTWFQSQQTNSVDIVYFDPMFETEVEKSHGFDPIRHISSAQSLSLEVINEAKRIARKRVILKDHFKSLRFKTLGFHVDVRRSATYQFGIIDLEKSENNEK
ncbi:class I SAM-dependent methyltransferase [Salipaludibacillus daqingensis]|uniref:class I SAM-dependent methyltransferase n=1 Tax=Salipaludibacillus daqingensis TaxID=3041001 RepID=UPI0024772434|nr:class I SAM-dependent methyltransferase [Salipaludibacillus daqingensis]